MWALKVAVFVVLLSVVLSSYASGSFRLPDGKLIREGKSKSEVIAMAGPPMYQEAEIIAVDEGLEGNPVKREILTYRMAGDIGGMYLVVVTVENNEVVSVKSKQESRL